MLQDDNKNSFIGMEFAHAKELWKTAGVRYRVVKVDGQSQIITMDYVITRLNLTIENHIITNITKG